MILFWTAALALVILLYVLLDGFDLGVGILFAFTREEPIRRQMLTAISPVWDGNETWLVVIGTILFGAFPAVYAAVLSAFYIPLVLALCGLILRGVAFEFRNKAKGTRWLWDTGFAGGSMVAAFVQGAAVGALARGLPIRDGQYAGGMFDWLSPFALLCGVGLCLGYALLGAGWLVLKCEGPPRETAYRLLPKLLFGVLVFLAIVFVDALLADLRIMARWIERPYLIIFPAVGAAGAALLLDGVRKRRDHRPFAMAAVIFTAAFCTLAISFWPYIIPFSVTITAAAAPPQSLSFLFWGAGIIVLPLTLIYTVIVYRMFRGKIDESAGYH
jgi:cytochrome d ubiquinol oxidase subunit II